MTSPIAAQVRRARSNFYVAMRLMPRERRTAMFAVYALARTLDDITDAPGDADGKRQALASWRAEIDAIYAGSSSTAIGRALVPVVARFDLPRAEFLELLYGLEMDLAPSMRAPGISTLALYCRRVAGSIGLITLRIFEADDPPARAFALALGHAMQLTNILRDIAEDAGRDRLYLPREILDGAGIAERQPARVLEHPAFPKARAAFCAHVRRAFDAAETSLAACPNRRGLWPGLVMMAVYRRLFDQLDRPHHVGRAPGRIGLLAQLWIALRTAWSVRWASSTS
ncbi:MAG TPA: squalene/phytoene synthase family protein [Alphaproteobacteria bacterium]